jgi:2-hydroxy-3-keto-5-methylthiopentenyl-1-phosphate phosphatase
MTVGSVLVDFDGAACPIDVTSELCAHFATAGWQAHDEAVEREETTPRAALERQAAMLSAGRDEMLRFVLGSFAVAPSFVALVRWAESLLLPVAVVSDGFGFYVEPMLAAVGLDRDRVLADRLEGCSPPLSLAHPYAHPECLGCGTCKVHAVLDYRRRLGPVAFVGEGRSDRFAAHYGDVGFAKRRLVRICRDAHLDFLPWTTFDDVRLALTKVSFEPRSEVPRVCPGWVTDMAPAVQQRMRSR